ncbi:DUF4352 domain-containing protein [Streptomyces sp. NPDC001110]|uniref:Telomeric repeat-binding factor 2 n=1 Tax=Streptomyces pratensis (strain ATCC 33331 / IAF-45CD) TaxID=591167 RepID=A0A8D3WMM0_STRFA|nr:MULTISPECIES: DUF4352 domain-containing protein [unclassified Streptomyces]AGJ55417.1 hypothetical protein F750_2942 [Streptomyces sp. PAMC 26508]MDF6062960.1 DUF4352 domain-containing protein [Streptomyces sp. JH010]MEE1778840.1 DUF4352 domain-containing protein [Streptomyces sp. JV181]MYT52592.1 DUF4352 domain-containing protein [Streptomyces sp. SID7815]MYT60509.1 DUF4352 domain-containing protein [Streptomyces sp. SID7834]
MSQHTQPQQPYAPAQPPGSSPARNGLGISALVLGIIGTVSGLIPFFFWLAGILGLIALILGLAGRGRAKRGEATNKGVTTFGAVLGLVALILSVVGAVLTFKAVDEAVTDINKAVADSSASAKPATEGGAAAGGAAGGTEGKDDVLREGDSAAYDDGLEVTVNAPASYTADEFAIGHTKGNKAYTVSVVIENKGKEKYDATLVTVDARAGEDGVNAEQIFDGKVGEGFSGTVLPGKKITATYAFDAPADAKGLTVEVGPGLDWDASQWELKL